MSPSPLPPSDEQPPSAESSTRSCSSCTPSSRAHNSPTTRACSAKARSQFPGQLSLPFAIYIQSRFADELKATRVTAVHTGLLVGLFWVLVWCAFLSLQIVEDGTLFSLIVSSLRR